MNIKHYYVVIVGAGPAGLAVAEILKADPILSTRTLILEKGNALDKRICEARQGRKCKSCRPCNILSGVGGAGPYTDGKICLYPQDLNELFRSSQDVADNNEDNSEKINEMLERCKQIWTNHGVNDFKETKVGPKMLELRTEALKQDINYIPYSVLHIGSDGAKEVISRYVENLIDAGTEIVSNAEVTTVKKINNEFLITCKKNDTSEETKIRADFLVLALGRDVQKKAYVNQLLKDLRLTFKPHNLEIGCRVEVPYQIMEDVIQSTFDPKFTIITPTHQDSVRTFCTCHKGRIIREEVCINGHVDRSLLTENTNFAILVRWPLENLFLDDAMDFGNTIAKLTISYGKGKPIIQRLGDLRKGIASTSEMIKKSHIKPTLRLNWLVQSGDIGSCYPRRIVVDILEGLEKLDNIIKGVNNDQNLLYAPEIKPTCRIQLKEGIKTEVPNFYICGDFSGYTRGIAQAMCMGMMVGQDIVKEGKKISQLKLL
jgi:uncharacterized FAD-dependent dehydrogenase